MVEEDITFRYWVHDEDERAVCFIEWANDLAWQDNAILDAKVATPVAES